MTLFLSHRGESDDAPENTLEAFELVGLTKSIEAGREIDAGMNADTATRK